jgi:two-component system sensor histidine kinase AlgZ
VVDAASSLARFAARLRRELVIALAVGLPALGYVLATNETASRAFILLHGVVLFWLAPPAVALAGLLAAPHDPARATWRTLLAGVLSRGAGLALAVALMALLLRLLTGVPLDVIVGRPLVVALVPVFLAYALVAVALQWAELREHALRVQASEARARQAALAARIRPHFLFNALNCVEQLADTDPPSARLAVGRLARLLHAVLDASQRASSPLATELSLVDDYLGIEQIRFGARFQYTLTRGADMDALELPSTVLLTLAENAVKHGVERVPGAVAVRLSAERQPDGSARITVRSPRASAPALAARGSGYGLGDVRERLGLSHGRSSLVLEEREGEVHVELTLRS